MIKPLRAKQFATVEEIYKNSESRFAIPSKDAMPLAIDRITMSIPRYRKIKDLHLYFQVIPGFDPLGQIFSQPVQVLKILADHKAISVIQDNALTLKPIMDDNGISFTVLDSSCTYLSEDKLTNFQLIWTLRLHFAQKAVKILQRITESGIQNLMTISRELAAMYLAFGDKKLSPGSGTVGQEVKFSRSELWQFRQPKPLRLWKSNLKNVFILYLAMCAGCLAGFLVEVRNVWGTRVGRGGGGRSIVWEKVVKVHKAREKFRGQVPRMLSLPEEVQS
ncbi:uncharacterized protein LOC118433997 [Folsomia candida]|nr:uncharacterized protein LOC118433997 [Folsomia candida]